MVDEIGTERLRLRRWRIADAPALKAVLDANVEHLKLWIPWRVAAPGELEDIEERCAAWSMDFDAGRSFIWAIWTLKGELLGGVGIYPRDAKGRVDLPLADRAEVGYWLKADMTGKGYATEAARAAVEVAKGLPRVKRIEMRCDPKNAASIAVPKRLGFTEGHEGDDVVLTLEL